jgi:hypothetical protein
MVPPLTPGITSAAPMQKPFKIREKRELLLVTRGSSLDAGESELGVRDSFFLFI